MRNGITRLASAYDVGSGSVIAQSCRRHRHPEFLRFLTAVVAAVPKDLDLHLVLDNYATRKTSPFTSGWSSTPVPSALHPASSSWLNLAAQPRAERWFVELTNRKLRGSPYRSLTQLEDDIANGSTSETRT